MFRFLFITGLLIKYSLIYILFKIGLMTKSGPKILRNFFEEAGGSFIKFGQLLALRVDALPKEYALEMINLFDNVKPFSYEDVKNTFLEELGATPEKIFKVFEKSPFASASFGQVHAAKLENGHIVAIKVLRPGIEEKVLADFIVIDLLAYFADLFFKIEALPWGEFVKEFKKWTKNELDYQIEAENMEKMYKNISVNQLVIVPRVYRNLSTKRILVEEYIEGIPLSRVLMGLKDGRLTTEQLEKMGIDVKKVPSIYTQEFLREFLMDDIYHADPHPGNILILKNGKIALLDFGIIGQSITYNKVEFIKFLESYNAILIIPKDAKGSDSTKFDHINLKKPIYHFANFTAEELKTIIGSSLPATTSEKQLDQIMHLLAEHFSEIVYKLAVKGVEDLKTMKKDYTLFFLEIVKAAKYYKVRMPKETVAFIRALTVIGFLSKELNYDYRLASELKVFLQIHPAETLLDKDDLPPSFKRISREKAIEKLNDWLSYLIEIDPRLYQLVKDKFKTYNAVES